MSSTLTLISPSPTESSTKKTTYPIEISRDGKFWLIDIPDIGATQARRLDEVEELARDYISGMLDVPEDSFDIEATVQFPEVVIKHLASSARLRSEAARAQAEAASELRAAAQSLKSAGLTLREMGTVLGVSHQRAQQLVSESTGEWKTLDLYDARTRIDRNRV